MTRYVLRRLLIMVPTFFGITLICFLVLRMANADPMASSYELGLKGSAMSAEALAQLRALYDLDQPWYLQYLRLLRRLITLDLGTRWQDGRPIAAVIGEALPVTLLLSFVSLTLAYLIAIPLGVYSAIRQGTLRERLLTVVLFALYSLPSFWVGTLLLVFFASGKYVDCGLGKQLGCFPLQGWHMFEGFESLSWPARLADVAWHLVLPTVTLTYNALASLSRYMRSSMLETIRQDYIRTARAKGLSERAVVFKHALRNSLIPIVTLFGLTLPYLIGGSVIVESIFGIRGMGLVALEAIRLPDYPLVITVVAFTALVTMVGLLVSDILYALVDPRITFDSRGKR
jgi:peptide/nickel transport system permease protein